jgi:hypothetical protein
VNMKIILIIITALVFSSCVTIPRETVTLSKTIGKDLQALNRSHRNSVEIYYKKIKDDINHLINDNYAPSVIHYVLKGELEKYRDGDSSIFRTIEIAGHGEGKQESENAIREMQDFLIAAWEQIEAERTELLDPILKQEAEIVFSIDQAYKNVIYANATITGYLESVQKVKETQKEALALIGLAGVDTITVNTLANLSEQVSNAISEAEKIDMYSESAFNQFKAVTDKIKELTSKK